MDKSIKTIIKELREGKTSPVTIFDELQDNIKRTDNYIKSYLALNESARDEAVMAEHALKKGKAPFFTGIPVSVKDLIDTQGIATTFGNDYFKSNVPGKDAEVVAILKKAGGYILGKTNTHEFALGMESSPTSNPYDTSRIPGGSSGGSAAAVAAGSALFAIGSDTGGSIRIPSSMCGVTGLKPTYGSISVDGVFPESWSLDHLGPITRFASDIHLLMLAMGRDIGHVELRKPVKAAVITDYLDQCDPGVRKVVEEAIEVLVSGGLIETVEMSSDLVDRSIGYHEVIDTSEIATIHRELFKEHPEIYLETSVEQIEAGKSRSAVEYVEATRQRDVLYSKFEKEMADARFVISPTMAKTAPLKSEVRKMTLAEHESYVKFQVPYNYLGNPVLNVPCGFTNGLPVGLQIISRRGYDAEAVSLGVEYQKLTDWHLKHPGSS